MLDFIFNKKLYCTKPFQELAITPNGEVKVCCDNWMKDGAYILGDAKTQNIEEIWNSKKAQDFRESILDNSYKYCDEKRCPFLKSNSDSGSIRKYRNLSKEMRKILKEKSVKLETSPSYIHFSFDQSCNLSCPSCRDHHFIDKENKDFILSTIKKIEHECKDAKEFNITGSGDPFGSPYLFKFLRELSKENFPKLERIHFHTNGILWNERNWNKLSPFTRSIVKTADITIDASTSYTYSINRRGGDFNELLENLSFISNLELERMCLLFVVQENNYLEMPKFVKIAKKFNVDQVLFTRLDNWGTFSEEDFKKRSIFNQDHPKHKDYLNIINSLKGNDFVSLGNL